MLTQLCRDGEHPLFGSFDRSHWHYKIRDFSSMVLHQGVILLDLIARGEMEFCLPDLNTTRAAEWRAGSLRFWLTQQRRNGSFDEYYPFESGFPPTAFSLYATSVVTQEAAPDDDLLQGMSRAAAFLLSRRESEAVNQEVVALAACSLAGRAGVTLDASALSRRWDQLFAEQSPEGWFHEYGGADTGYLSVACDALWDYYSISGDERALQALHAATQYIHSLLTVADDIPAMINSRNTDYLVPYGLASFAQEDRLASEVVHRSLRRIDDPSHFFHHIDERYSVHYVYTSICRALGPLGRMCDPDGSAPKQQWFADARVFVHHAGDESVHVAAGKGGVVTRTQRDGQRAADYGWRGEIGGALTATHWQEPKAEVECTVQEHADQVDISIRMPLRTHRFLVPSPFKHFVLRVLARCCGRLLIPWLKDLLIFRKQKSQAVFLRRIAIVGGEIRLDDGFEGTPVADLRHASGYSLRHVSSAGSFSLDELRSEPLSGFTRVTEDDEQASGQFPSMSKEMLQ